MTNQPLTSADSIDQIARFRNLIIDEQCVDTKMTNQPLTAAEQLSRFRKIIIDGQNYKSLWQKLCTVLAVPITIPWSFFKFWWNDRRLLRLSTRLNKRLINELKTSGVLPSSDSIVTSELQAAVHRDIILRIKLRRAGGTNISPAWSAAKMKECIAAQLPKKEDTEK